MPKKSVKKKKAYKEICLRQARKGSVNDTDGHWIDASRVRVATTASHALAGRKL